MLARQLDYAWEEEQQERTIKPVAGRSFCTLKNEKYKIMRRRAALFAFCLLSVYCVTVFRSEVLVSKSNELVNLKQQETSLLMQNSEQKILVEQLKGPERITTIASQRLGMKVARNNIYVKADKEKIAYDGYAYAK